MKSTLFVVCALFLFLTVPAGASPLACLTDLAVEPVHIDPLCPGFNNAITAVPGTLWAASFEGIPTGTYNDVAQTLPYDDYQFTVLFNSAATSALLTYIGSNTAWEDLLRLNGDQHLYNQFIIYYGTTDTVTTAPGQTLPLVFNWRNGYVNGGGYTEWDLGTPFAWVGCISGNCPNVPEPPRPVVAAVPEPSFAVVTGMTLLLGLWIAAMKRKGLV